MKNALLTLTLFLCTTVMAFAQPGNCTTDVFSACFGDNCGFATTYTYTVTAADVAASPGNVARLCFSADRGNLCPNTAASFTVDVNGSKATSADLTLNPINNLSIANSKEGDTITITVSTFPNPGLENVQCVTFGAFNFQLRH